MKKAIISVLILAFVLTACDSATTYVELPPDATPPIKPIQGIAASYGGKKTSFVQGLGDTEHK